MVSTVEINKYEFGVASNAIMYTQSLMKILALVKKKKELLGDIHGHGYYGTIRLSFLIE
jgi:hypothetical protein